MDESKQPIVMSDQGIVYTNEMHAYILLYIPKVSLVGEGGVNV